MAYQFTCIINGENIELDKMEGHTKLSALLVAIQRKSGIPPSRQQLMAEMGNVDTQQTDKTLSQLHLSTNCHFLVLDSNPDGDLEILPSPKHNPNTENTENNDLNDIDINMANNEIKEEKEEKVDENDKFEFAAFVLEEDENKIDGELIAENEINELLLILFGTKAKPNDMDRWYSQGLGFIKDNDNNNNNNNNIRFGLLQIHGGPCGVMAPVQAYMLKEMLFDSTMGILLDDGSEIPVLPNNEQREEALIRALIHIVCKAAIDETYITWIVSADRWSDKYYRKIVRNGKAELRALIVSTLPLLRSRIGVISFVLSVLLSRSLAVCLDEVDDKTQPLILSEFGHCSQELVNLMITGKCVTNIHDGNKALGDASLLGADTFILRGIEANQEIGFLTTLEAMRLAKVGNNYKCPSYPIWVVGSSSHYTTLFALNINVSKISKYDKKMQQLRHEFNIFDVEEHGIIKTNDLQQLLTNLKSNFSAYQIKPYFDTGQVILWSDFERIWKMLENQENYGWNCLKCTFWNKMDANMCNICGNNKGDAPIIEREKNAKDKEPNDDNENENENENDKPPQQFTMYLYNGLKATKKDRPQITKLSVWAEAELHEYHSESEELQSLIRCKFPFAIVEYGGAYAPKIM